MQINFNDTNKFKNNTIHTVNEKEFDKFINAIRIVGDIKIKDNLYKVDYIGIVLSELETQYNFIEVGIHKYE